MLCASLSQSFRFVSAPKISTFAHDELIEWQKARVDYEHAMNERCKDGKEDVSSVILSIKSSIEDDLMETLARYAGAYLRVM